MDAETERKPGSTIVRLGLWLTCAWLAVGCGGGGGDGNGGDGGDDCTPATCAELGRECGSWDDGCGGTVDCPACAGEQSCAADGQCVDECVPASCAELGKECGSWDDGCGGTLDCPACAGEQSCDADGQCVDECVPLSCAELGRECGSWDDGCGGTLDCPACSGDQSCDADGQCVGGEDPGAPLFASAGHYQTSVPAPSDNANDSYPTEVHYPDPPDLQAGDYSFPVALLLQGAKVDPAHYSSFAGWMARYGFVVLIPKRDTMMMQNFTAESVVMDVAAHLPAENGGDSPIAGKLDIDTLVLLGHSHGGLCGAYALQDECSAAAQCFGGFTRPAAVRGGAFYGTFVTTMMGTYPEIANDGLPMALVQGSLDGKADPAKGENTYAEIQDPPKAFITIEGANHYGITDSDDPEGADADPNEPALDQALANETSARWTALFLRATVLDDAVAADYVFSSGADGDPNASIEFQQ